MKESLLESSSFVSKEETSIDENIEENESETE
jgi:hypothetical protein